MVIFDDFFSTPLTIQEYISYIKHCIMSVLFTPSMVFYLCPGSLSSLAGYLQQRQPVIYTFKSHFKDIHSFIEEPSSTPGLPRAYCPYPQVLFNLLYSQYVYIQHTNTGWSSLVWLGKLILYIILLLILTVKLRLYHLDKYSYSL